MTTDLLDWDEDLQIDSEEEYQALLNGLKRSQGFGLFFVQCSPFSGDKLVERVKADLMDKNIDVLKFEKPIADGNVFKRVNAFLQEGSPIDVLFIQGLENSLFDAEETKKRLGWSDKAIETRNWREVPTVLTNLNQQRERFRDSFQCCLVFLLPQYAIKYVVHRAPDFFDWRSGMFEYASDPKTLAQESARILQEADYDAYCNWSSEERSQRILQIHALLEEQEIVIKTQAKLLFEQGSLFAASNKYSIAAISFERAVALKPDYRSAWHNWGVALGKMKHYEEAINKYDRALSIKPDHTAALYNKGIALAALGQKEAAIICYDKALVFKPNYHEALNNKGTAMAALSRYAMALACYDQALTIRPSYYRALYNKACCYGLQGDVENAVKFLQEAIALASEYRDMAKTDTDFDAVRDDPRFQALLEENE
ncbi:MAG: tetratricopeptide repeat protein [Leptolyngbya sp. SIO1E4]|nr:tetratricopeptide repeat protein [Leptolyngbya sp. SIO1E4]